MKKPMLWTEEEIRKADLIRARMKKHQALLLRAAGELSTTRKKMNLKLEMLLLKAEYLEKAIARLRQKLNSTVKRINKLKGEIDETSQSPR